jgi:hypothetical protein
MRLPVIWRRVLAPRPRRTKVNTAGPIWFRGQGFHPGVELRANLKSISHRCHLFEVAFARRLTKETMHLPLGCLQGGPAIWRRVLAPQPRPQSSSPLLSGFGSRVSSSGFRDSGFGIWVSSFGIRDSGFGVRDPGFGSQFSSDEFCDPGFGIRDSDFGIRVSGFGFRYPVSSFGIRISGFGIQVYPPQPPHHPPPPIPQRARCSPSHSPARITRLGIRISRFGIQVSGFGIRVIRFGFRVRRCGFRASGLSLR